MHSVLEEWNSLARLSLRQGQTSSPVLTSGLGLFRLEKLLDVLGCVVELVLSQGQFEQFREPRLRLEDCGLFIGTDGIVELLRQHIEISESEYRQRVFRIKRGCLHIDSFGLLELLLFVIKR